MAYDVHIVRTRNWLEASTAPITRPEVEALIAGDPELAWSTTDYVDMRDETGAVTRYWMITWQGRPCFWWYRGQVQCSNPDDAQRSKLRHIARTLNAFAVGDDGESLDGSGGPAHPQTGPLGERLARWFSRLRSRRRPVAQPPPLPFAVGDTVQDPWDNEHTVISIDPAAEHGLGQIRTRRRDGTEHTHSLTAHGLVPIAKHHDHSRS